MLFDYGFNQIIDRLGIVPRRRFIHRITNDSQINVNTTGVMEVRLDRDFLVDRICVDVKYDGTWTDGFLGIRNITENKNYYNYRGSFLNGNTPEDTPLAPFSWNASEPTPWVLPWIIRGGTNLGFTWNSPFGSVLVNEMHICLIGWKLDSIGAESPYYPFMYTLNDKSDLAQSAKGVTDQVVINGPSDFICTSITSREDIPSLEYVLQMARREPGSQLLWDRQNRGLCCLMRPDQYSSEGALPYPYLIPNGSAIWRQLDEDKTAAGAIRRPQMMLFGFFKNPNVFGEGM